VNRNHTPIGRRMKRTAQGQGGFVLVLSLLTLALLSSIGLAALYQSNGEVTVVGNERTGNSLLLAADSGVEFGKNEIWAQSGFGAGTSVSFSTLDAYFAGKTMPFTMGPLNLTGDTYYTVTVPDTVDVPGEGTVDGYDTSDASKRMITFQARAWHDTNNNGSFDAGEQSRMVTSRVSFQYGSLSFPYGVLTQNVECIFCHAKIVGDVVSLETMTVRKSDEAYSTVLGKVYTMGDTNLDQADKRVVKTYTDQDGNPDTVEDAGEEALDITTNYADPDRFPVDENGNPSFPQIENLDYYKGLAANYDGGNGSTLSGGTITTVPTGSDYASGAVNVGSIDQSYGGNVILTGTPGNCIQLNGPMVVDGDLIIRGCVEGEGSLYAGGNVYVPDSVTYNDASNDKLAFAAGGNIIIGDYRDTSAFGFFSSKNVGGGGFMKQEEWEFNTKVKSNYPAGERRYYAAEDGKVYTDGSTVVTPAAGDIVVKYTPAETAGGGAPWITSNEYLNNFVDQVNGVTQVDALAYTANAIFGMNKYGDEKMTINGALVSADIGLLIPGPSFLEKNYNPDKVGLTLVYDDRMENFLSVARNPTKRTVSWREGS
jgi:Tfp pilus assembly protein PilX